VLAFPFTGLLDNFGRGTGNVALGANWAGPLSQTLAAYQINSFDPPGTPSASRMVQVRTVGANGLITWAPAAFGADQEAFFTINENNTTTTATEQALALKISNLSGGAVGPATTMIKVSYNRAVAPSQVSVATLSGGVWTTQATWAATFSAGQQLGARAQSNGVVSVYRSGTLVGSIDVTATAIPWPAPLAQGGGNIGVWFTGTSSGGAQDAHFDNFGGGTMP